MKLLIWTGIVLGGIVGGWIGALLSHNNWFSLMSIAMSGVGSVVGIVVAYKIGKSYL